MAQTRLRSAPWFSYPCIAAGAVLLVASTYQVQSSVLACYHFSILDMVVRLGAALCDVCLIAAGFALLERSRRAFALGLFVCLPALAIVIGATCYNWHDWVVPLGMTVGISFVVSLVPVIFGRRAARAVELPGGQPEVVQQGQTAAATMRRAALVTGIVLIAYALFALLVVGATGLQALEATSASARSGYGGGASFGSCGGEVGWAALVLTAASAGLLLVAAIQAIRCKPSAANWLIRSALCCAGAVACAALFIDLQPMDRMWLNDGYPYYRAYEVPKTSFYVVLACQSAIGALLYAAAYLYLRRVTRPPAATPAEPLPVALPV